MSVFSLWSPDHIETNKHRAFTHTKLLRVSSELNTNNIPRTDTFFCHKSLSGVGFCCFVSVLLNICYCLEAPVSLVYVCVVCVCVGGPRTMSCVACPSHYPQFADTDGGLSWLIEDKKLVFFQRMSDSASSSLSLLRVHFVYPWWCFFFEHKQVPWRKVYGVGGWEGGWGYGVDWQTGQVGCGCRGSGGARGKRLTSFGPETLYFAL